MTLTRISYPQIRTAFDRVRQATGTPVQHEVSLPVPSLRWDRAVFAGFAGPARHQPGQPVEFATPDRWWTVDAGSGRLVSYALVSFLPFPGDLAAGPVTRPRTGRGAAAATQDLRQLTARMQDASAAFLARSGPGAETPLLVESLQTHLAPGELQWYRALAPDFFDWLEVRP